MPAQFLFSPYSYIFGDILTEVSPLARSRRVIWIGFLRSARCRGNLDSINLPAAPL